MSNPVLAEVTRGPHVESYHRGAFAVVDGDGKLVHSAGEIDKPVYPRSAVKAIQALLLVETGAADKLGFGNAELAFAQSSHSGEPGHVAMAERMLAAAGFSERDLECGSHWPTRHRATLDLAASGLQPTQLHNNCSGKHAGFLCVCGHCGIAPNGYVGVEHEFQAQLRGVTENVTGYRHQADDCGYDGCGIPTYPVPLRELAFGFARMATGTGLGRERAVAAKRLIGAAMAEPWYVAGTKRICTQIMETAKGRIFAKTGAEGVYCGAVPELGIGIALKVDDGTTRAAECAMAGLLAQVMNEDSDLKASLRALSVTPIHNRRGCEVGEIHPGEPLA